MGAVLQMLVREFCNIYICRGNHEKRWMDIKGGFTLRQLYCLTGIPPEDVEGNVQYHLTPDDHMHLNQAGETWLLAHPRNYRQVPLSVVRDLAAVHQMNVFGAHGHQCAQGVDRSGRYHCLDGGGMFDKRALDYLRETTTHPETKAGFYLLQDGLYRCYTGGV